MTDDYHNSFIIVPIKTDLSILSSVDVSDVHPWRDLYLPRVDPPEEANQPPATFAPPARYKDGVHEPQQYYITEVTTTKPTTRRKGGLVNPPPVAPVFQNVGVNEIIRLCDVEKFRAATAMKVPLPVVDEVDGLSDRITRLSTYEESEWIDYETGGPVPMRPVIYRYVDVINDSIALLEAIHFELFMPDRPDLRFLGIPFAAVPSGTVEGDLFRVLDAVLLSTPSFGVKLERSYPVLWEACGIVRMEFAAESRQELAGGLSYVVKPKASIPGAVMTINDVSEKDMPIRQTLFPEDCRSEHSLVWVTSRAMGTAQLYAVEPPKPGPKTSKKKKKDVTEEPQFDSRSEYLKLVCNVHTSSQRSGRIVSEVRAVNASEAERIKDRLGPFTGYGKPGSLALLDVLFRLGCRYRQRASGREDAKDAGEMRVDESIILKTLLDKDLLGFSYCRPLLDCIYDRSAIKAEIAPATTQYFGGLKLNEAQSRALRAYADVNGPRVFCILSPPGSGKTTVAAAMAAEVAIDFDWRRRELDSDSDSDSSESLESDSELAVPTRYERQLLLSVQNVAVDNIGVALKKMGFGRSVYNMKATKMLDPHAPAPFDFLDTLNKAKLEDWKTNKGKRKRQVIQNRKEMTAARGKYECAPQYATEVMNYEDCLTFDRREYERTLPFVQIVLSTVEMVLQKFYTHGNLRNFLNSVKRIIIDEASLLTEAALFCLIRRFPKARIVLIGDNHQLPPFMYDSTKLGHELAGRPALSVAMKTGRVPVLEMIEVYRAPPSLVAPYNRLAYEERLVSKKAEGDYPLSEIGLIPSGLPQLLLIDVNGTQERNEKTMSLSNANEVEALERLLRKFPESWTEDIMIICLYKDQKHKLHNVLSKDYTILTVDSAQGKEKGIVILMTTRTEKANDFFCSIERCNVAVSRQQKALIILGKATLLTTTASWSTVVNGHDFTRIKAEDI